MESSTLRIFVSSTFSDMHAERRVLAERVFPVLEALCREHDAELQVIDLRWGVSPEAVLAQRTRQICLREIERCQTLTLRPSFIALVGQRYGHCPLPDAIPASVFEAVVAAFSGDPRLQTFREWYQLDLNAVPAHFVLRERRDSFRDEHSWASTVVEPIQSLLRDSAGSLDWDEAARVSYTGSLTHQEILYGAFVTAGSDPPHAFAYVRTITDLADNERSRLYQDSTPAGVPDLFARAQVAGLRNRVMNVRGLPHRAYDVSFGSPENRDRYLDCLAKDVLADLSGVIKGQLAALKVARRSAPTGLPHAERSRLLSSRFIGRQPLVDELMAALADPTVGCVSIVGPSGSGKSFLLARVAGVLSQDPSDPIVISRFIGYTPDVVSAAEVLRSVITELTEQTGLVLDTRLSRDPLDLWRELTKTLKRIDPGRQVYLLLDDAEILGSQFDWQKPGGSNLKLCVTLSAPAKPFGWSTSTGQVRAVRSIQVPRLEEPDARLLLHSRLSEQNRTLTDKQFNQILAAFSASGLPRWLNMASHYAVTLRSFDALPRLGGSLPQIGLQVLDLLTDQRSHGRLLISRVLAYLACSRFGLTEREVIALLEEDADVMQAVRAGARHELPEARGRVRMPTVIWSRLFFELDPFLDASQPLSVRVLRLEESYSSSIVFGALLPSADKVRFHQRLAMFFERWEKPLTGEEPIADERAATELLYQELQAKRFAEASRLLWLPEYVAARARYYGSTGMLQDYDLASSTSGFNWPKSGELTQCRNLVVYLAGARPRTIEEHEQFAEKWHEPENRSLPDLRGSSSLERTATLLASVLEDYAELYTLWETLYLAHERDNAAVLRHFKRPSETRHELIPIPALGLYITKYPITVEEFAACCAYYRSPWSELSGKIPATGVNWREANFFAIIHGGRLPTYSEWVVAAGGLAGFIYPWGNQPIRGACNLSEAGVEHPTPVDAYDRLGASPDGVCDMVGNTWEFTASSFPTLREGLLEAEYDPMEQPAIAGGCYETTLIPSRKRAGAAVLRGIMYGELDRSQITPAMSLFEQGCGVGKLDMCLFDAGNQRIGFRYVVDFTPADYFRHSQKVLEACQAIPAGNDRDILTVDGVRCCMCSQSVQPNEAVILSTSVTSPAVVCRGCLKPFLPSVREMARAWGDGRVFYGHSLMPLVAGYRNSSFRKLPHVRVLLPDSPIDAVLDFLEFQGRDKSDRTFGG